VGLTLPGLALPSAGFAAAPWAVASLAIRGTFDQFLDRLGRFNQFVKGGLIEADELRPYLHYWIDEIATAFRADQPAARLKQLHHYVREYRITEVLELFQALGSPLSPDEQTDEEIERLIALDVSGWKRKAVAEQERGEFGLTAPADNAP
jgi:hypothetical protein